MYKSLYREMRPETFDEVIGQDHIVKVLRHQIQTGQVNHAYLFTGTRGTGKTTVARLLAKAVNCQSEGERPCGECQTCKEVKDGIYLDLIELDAASNNSVQDIRDIVERVSYPPAAGRKKVYIIDEVHMLSTSASNALLKTLEEPPEYVVFILATTEPDKLLQTILSRCMRFDFKRVSEVELKNHMKAICEYRGINISDGALGVLAANADGSVRDGLSLLEQCIAGGDREISREMVLDFIGAASEDFFLKLTDLLLVHNAADAIVLLDNLLAEGRDVKQVMKSWLTHYRALLLSKYIKNPEDMLNLSSENAERIRQQTDRLTVAEINDAVMIIAKAIADARYSTQPRILMELAMINLATDNFNGPARKREVEVQRASVTRKTVPQNQPQQRQVPQSPAQPTMMPQEPVQQRQTPQSPAQPTMMPKEPVQQRQVPQSPAQPTMMPQEPAQQRQAPQERENIQSSNTMGSEMPDRWEPNNMEPETTSAPESRPNVTEEIITDPQVLSEIWEHIFDRAGADNSSLYIVKMDSNLVEIGNKEYKVIVSNDFKRGMIERERQLFDRLMSEEMGRKMVLSTRIQGEEPAPNHGDQHVDIAEKVSKTAMEKWNIDVKIE